MDRTEAQLREKLLKAEFEPELVEQAVAYVKSYGYLDDERYVRNYIEYRKDHKSRRQIEQERQFRKGVPPELIQSVYEDLTPADEKVLIKKHLEKKHYCPGECDEKQRQKLIASLASVISYRLYGNSQGAGKGAYLKAFTLYNVAFLAVLYAAAALLLRN